LNESKAPGNATLGYGPVNASQTHHHLNVTLGEDKFYYTANENEKNGSKLPTITNLTGSSYRKIT
jgi:hypothetical protein